MAARSLPVLPDIVPAPNQGRSFFRKCFQVFTMRSQVLIVGF